MVTTTKIQKWGNSLAVRLPKALLRGGVFHEGSEVSVRETGTHLLITPAAHTRKPYQFKDWDKFIIPVKHKGKRTGTASRGVDQIVYGVSR